MEVIREEFEALEISDAVKTNVNLERINPKPQSTPTANALLSQHGTQTSPLRGIQVRNVHIARVLISQPPVKALTTQGLVLKF